MKRNTRIALIASASTALIVAPTIFAVLIAIYAPLSPFVGIALLAAGGAIVVCALLFNLIYYLSVRRKILHISMREQYEKMTRKLDEIRSDAERAKKKVRRLAVLCRLYAAVLYLAVFALAAGYVLLLFALCGKEELAYAVGSGVSLLITAFLGINPIGVLLPRNQEEPTPQEDVLSENEYPLLYETAKRAADAVGYRGAFRLVRGYREENGISVREDAGASVVLPPVAADILTRGELYQIFLHEFAHVVNGDTKATKKFANALNALSTEGGGFPKFMKSALFSAPCRILDDKFDDYRTCASLLKEQLADKAVHDFGNAKENIDGEVKSTLLSRFVGFTLRHFDYRILESETPPDDYYERLEAEFRTWCRENGDKEVLRMKRTLPARAASHPTLFMRMQAAGREEYDLTTVEANEAYRAETKKYVADCSAERKGWEGYEDYRKENYLDEKKKIDEYEAETQPDLLMKYEAMNGYLLADDDRALALADELLAADPDSPLANYAKGMILYERDERDGIDALRKAVSSCTHISATAAELYGDACLDTGDEELVTRMREGQAELAQMNVNALLWQYRFGKITNGSFRKTNLSKEKIEALKPVVRRIGKDAFDRVLLLRSVKKGKEAHVFVLFPKNNLRFEEMQNAGVFESFQALTAYLRRKDEFYAFLVTKRASSQAIAAMKCGLDLMKD